MLQIGSDMEDEENLTRLAKEKGYASVDESHVSLVQLKENAHSNVQQSKRASTCPEKLNL